MPIIIGGATGYILGHKVLEGSKHTTLLVWMGIFLGACLGGVNTYVKV